MHDMVKGLRREHRRFSILLNILEGEVHDYCAGEDADLNIISAVVEYFSGYPDACHHPKENLMYDKLRKRLPNMARSLAQIETEHDQSTQQIRELKHAIDNILIDRHVSRDVVESVTNRFVHFSREHIKQEESHFFPAIDEFLNDEDWQTVSGRMNNEEDPLVDPKDEGAFESLRLKITQWEAK